jgi:hypothetical protein
MLTRIPSRKVCERFFLIYELKGCQEAVNFLSRHYGIRRMKVVLDGRRAGRGNSGCYFDNKAYFTKKGLSKRTILHELYHHLVDNRGWDLPSHEEERNADRYAREFLENRYS